MTLSGERPALKEVFEYPPEKTRKLESYIRPVETRTTNISGGNNPRFVIHVAHVIFNSHTNGLLIKCQMKNNQISETHSRELVIRNHYDSLI